MPRQPLTIPDGYGVVELCTRRFCPVSVEKEERFSRFSPLYWDYQRIPFALGPHRQEGHVSFASHREAVLYCQLKAEEWEVLHDCDKQAARCEVYPERNVWYREALTEQSKAHSAPWSERDPIYITLWNDCSMALWLTVEGTSQSIRVQAPNQDEAFAYLSTQVCATLGPQSEPELSPLRNAYYREAIQEIAQGPLTCFTSQSQAIAYVWLPDGSYHTAHEATIDDALHRLCELVYAHVGLDLWNCPALAHAS